MIAPTLIVSAVIVNGLVTATTLIGAAGVGPASPTAAYSTCAAYGANVACVSPSGHTIFWCDRESDGHKVYAQYSIRRSGVVTSGVVSGSECGHMSDVSKIVRFRVCEIRSGCSAWKWA